MPRLTPDQLLQELTGAEDLLIVQDLDGVCMQLVKDPPVSYTHLTLPTTFGV